MRSTTLRRTFVMRLAVVPLCIALLLALASCGSSDEPTVKDQPRVPTADFASGVTGPEHAPALAAQTYVIARNTGDSDTLCDLTSFNDKALKRCQDQLGSSFQAVTQVSYKLKNVRLNDADDADVFLIQTKPPQKGANTVTQFTMQKVDGEWKVRTVGFS